MKEKDFKLLHQINEDKINENNLKKELDYSTEQLTNFTEEEIVDFTQYNERVTQLDPMYTSLAPRGRDVILRLMVKDFTVKNDDVLIESKMDFIPVKSGANSSIVYMQVPSPYAFTRKAVVISVPNEHFDIKPGDTVVLREKLQIGFKNQDQGEVSVQGAFVHPDYEDNYTHVPEDPNDPHFGYVIVDESLINIKIN